LAALDDDDEQSFVDEFVGNPVPPLANPVALETRKFFATDRTWIARQRFDAFEDSQDGLFWNGVQVLGDRAPELQLISCPLEKRPDMVRRGCDPGLRRSGVHQIA
jgi:hypothetical protein